jgi:hypothetical protein
MSHIHSDDVRYFHKRTTIPLTLITAMLRLGTKYNIKYLLEEIIPLLSLEYASKLDVWDERGFDERFDTYDGVLFDLVNLMREFGLLHILPALFLRVLAEYKTEEILQGCRRPDGSLSIMSTEDRNQCILGLHRISCVQTRSILQSVNVGPPTPTPKRCDTPEGDKIPDCNTRKRCARLQKEKLLGLLELPVKVVWIYSLSHGGWDDEGWCDSCCRSFKKKFGRARQEMWDALPSYFDLPGWEELRRNAGNGMSLPS